MTNEELINLIRELTEQLHDSVNSLEVIATYFKDSNPEAAGLYQSAIDRYNRVITRSHTMLAKLDKRFDIIDKDGRVIAHVEFGNMTIPLMRALCQLGYRVEVN